MDGGLVQGVVMPDDLKDPDGLPIPDAATMEAMAALAREALTARPKAADWAVLVASLHWAVEAQRRGEAATNARPDTTSARLALKAIIQFLEKQRCVMRHGASIPLIALQAALIDLSDGRVSPILKPTLKPAHNPGKGRSDAMRIGMTARAMSLLMEGGDSEAAAAQHVARVLGVRAATVKNWRGRMEQGKGPGAPQEAVAHYRAALPDPAGRTSIQQGERLLELLKERAPFRPKSQYPLS